MEEMKRTEGADPIARLREWAEDNLPDDAGATMELGRITADIEAGYMRLPLDADGVPIRLGDTVKSGFLSIGPIDALIFNADGTCELGEGGNTWSASGNERHVAETVESVLDEFAGYVEERHFKGTRGDRDTVARYAERIRALS